MGENFYFDGLNGVYVNDDSQFIEYANRSQKPYGVDRISINGKYYNYKYLPSAEAGMIAIQSIVPQFTYFYAGLIYIEKITCVNFIKFEPFTFRFGVLKFNDGPSGLPVNYINI